jgi:hypothetical protein
MFFQCIQISRAYEVHSAPDYGLSISPLHKSISDVPSAAVCVLSISLDQKSRWKCTETQFRFFRFVGMWYTPVGWHAG